MNTGKVWAKTGKRTITEDIEEIGYDLDYTQVYGCFNNIAHQIKSVTSFKLLFWLLSMKTNRTNGIECGKRSFNEFNAFLSEKCPACHITERTYYNCLSELASTGIIKKHEKNNYMANMFVFWKGKTLERAKLISANKATGEDMFINPHPQEELEYKDEQDQIEG